MSNVKNLAVMLGQLRTDYPIIDETARSGIAELVEDLTAVENSLDKLWNVGESAVLYVSKRNSRFATINDAITYARTYCSTTDRVTIVISSGRYEEYIDVLAKSVL